MNLVYSPQAVSGSLLELDENEYHHKQVLRMRDGDPDHEYDGRGHLYKGTLVGISKKTASISVGELLKKEAEPTAQLQIAIAPTKNIDRTEWFAEKSTEIGIQTIIPIICRRSERREIRVDRLQKVVLSAAKQSLHLHLPAVNESTTLEKFLKLTATGKSKKFIAYCEEKTIHLRDSFKSGESIIVLIGPEGDFTDEEVSMAKGAGFIPVSLGESRLRTETAGVMVAATFSLKN
ncbi:MAG: Ribosomal small subunit methyltransferase [Bacteroidetes bacterium]|nr:Ribosomal small subunit methyltransferase [Bacteroidota bacterium]